MLLHVDGWLCEIKDVQIRDGLHVLGRRRPARRGRPGAGDPAGPPDVGRASALPGLREALGPRREDGTPERADVDAVEAGAARWSRWMAGPGWVAAAADVDAPTCRAGRAARRASRGCCGSRPPRWCRGWRGTADEIDRGAARAGRRLRAGRAVRARRCAAWSTCCRPAATSTRSTPRRSRRGWPGRPGRRWPTRCSSATAPTHGEWPRRSGCRCGAPSAMRTAGDDIAEVLALLGVRPVWDDASRRVTGLEPSPLAELGRPRIDVTVRISGFFRDAFPHVVALLDDAVQLVADLDEPAEDNFVRAHARRRPRRARRPAARHDADLRLQAGRLRAGPAAADRQPQLARRRRPRRGLRGLGRLRLRPRPRRAARPAATWRPRTGGSRWRRRTPTPASTTSPTPTTTSSTTAAWSPPCAR